MQSSNVFLQQVIALAPTMRAFGRSLCADAALTEDLVQDTILKAWDNRARFEMGSNLKAWLLTILRNRYYSELRHRQFEVEDPEGKHAAGLAVQPEHELTAEMDALSRALDELRDEQRQALLLVFAGGLSYAQAAAMCNCAVGTIKSRIARGRDHLAALLKPNGTRRRDNGRDTERRESVNRDRDSDASESSDGLDSRSVAMAIAAKFNVERDALQRTASQHDASNNNSRPVVNSRVVNSRDAVNPRVSPRVGDLNALRGSQANTELAYATAR
jgi:RNA polymerase sigma-70 factor (ECF subfamily)